MTHQHSMQPYLDSLAGATAAPGGGSAAAVAGAMGAALVSMVCNLTIGKEKFSNVDAQMREILEKSEALRVELTQLSSDDSEAFEQVMAAFRLPKSTDEGKAARLEAIQAATKQATLTPLATARACGQVIELCRQAAEMGNPNAVSDAGAGAACAQAGLQAASLNVLINLPSIKDQQFASTCKTDLDEILTKLSLANDVFELVKSKL